MFVRTYTFLSSTLKLNLHCDGGLLKLCISNTGIMPSLEVEIFGFVVSTSKIHFVNLHSGVDASWTSLLTSNIGFECVSENDEWRGGRDQAYYTR